MGATQWIGCGLAVLAAAGPALGATRVKPAGDHRWQFVMLDGVPAAIATRCADCAADAILRCPVRGRGLVQLTLTGAAVANGRAEATKQIRLTVGGDSLRRRALTKRTQNGFTPVIELAADDVLLDRLEQGPILKVNFYGQRGVVGLAGAEASVAQVRAACRPGASAVSGRHCTWSVVIECASVRATADSAAQRIPGAFVRATADRFCVTLASQELALAKARAARFGGHVERSCLP